MARVTIEDCVENVPNRFLLVQAAVRRTRQLMEGSRPLLHSKNRPSVIALREIASQKVRPYLDPSKPPEMHRAPRRRGPLGCHHRGGWH
jgi:DNA-directed RNA polymerase subunit omega